MSNFPPFLRLKNVPLQVYITPANGRLCCSHILATVNNAIKIGVQIPVRVLGFYFGYILRNEIAGSYGIPVLF